MTAKGYSKKPVLLGRSRGGPMALSWATANPDKVGGFAGIYPVCDIASYPGVERAAGAFDLKPDELKERLKQLNPVDRLERLAKAKLPLFAIHGDIDRVVPLEANSGRVKERYAALGGTTTLIVPPQQGHNMWPGFFQCRELVELVIASDWCSTRRRTTRWFSGTRRTSALCACAASWARPQARPAR